MKPGLWARFMCWVGRHNWLGRGPNERVCIDCWRHEALEFYSDRTHEWVEVSE